MSASEKEMKPSLSVILGLPFHNITQKQAKDEFYRILTNQNKALEKPHYFLFADTDNAIRAYKNSEQKQVYFYADRVFCSSIALRFLSNFADAPIEEHLPRCTILKELLGLSEKIPLNVFLVGSKKSNLSKILPLIKKKFPKLNVAGHIELDPEKSVLPVLDRIKTSKPNILLVALEPSTEEPWIYSNHKTLNIPITLGAGGNFYNIFKKSHCNTLNCIARSIRNTLFVTQQIFEQRWTLKRSKNKTKMRLKKDILSTEAFHKISWTDNVERARLEELPIPPDFDRHVILECSQVRFMDSMGLGKMVQLARRAKKENKLFALLKPSKVVCKAIESMQLEKLIPIFHTTYQLEDYFKSHEECFLLIKKNSDIEGYTIKPFVNINAKILQKIEEAINDLRPKLGTSSKIILSLEYIDSIDPESINGIVNLKNKLELEGVHLRLSMIHNLPRETFKILELKKVLVNAEPVTLEIIEE